MYKVILLLWFVLASAAWGQLLPSGSGPSCVACDSEIASTPAATTTIHAYVTTRMTFGVGELQRWTFTSTAIHSNHAQGPWIQGAPNPRYARYNDTDTGINFPTDNVVTMDAGGDAIVQAEADGVYLGPSAGRCKDYGELESAPPGATRCDRYYDKTAPGAFCIKNNAGTYDKIGAGTCL